MRGISLFALFLLTGCHPRIRVGSPQFQRAPEITCVVFVQGDHIDAALAQAAINACREAVGKGGEIIKP